MKTIWLLIVFPLHILAQPASKNVEDLAGIWKGYISTSQKKLQYELVISEQDGKFIAYSYTTFIVNGDEIISLKKMNIRFLNKEIIFEDEDLLFNNFTSEAPKKIKQINTLILKKEGEQLSLTGTFETKTNRALRPASGDVYLQKKDDPADTKIISKLEELKLTGNLSFPLVDNTKNVSAISTTEVALITTLDKISEVYKEIPDTTTMVSSLKPLEIKNERRIVITKEKSTAPFIVVAKPIKKIYIPAIQSTPVIAKQPILAKPTITYKPTPVTPAPKNNPPIVVKIFPAAKPKPVNIEVAPVLDLANRKIETIQQLYIQSDSLQMTLYDNGDVDGDSVSIILNGKTIVSKQGLSTIAFTKTIYLTPDMGDTIQLVMYAENLGSLPPNTGLLLLQFDKKRHEIRFSGDLNKNAAITLRRKERQE